MEEFELESGEHIVMSVRQHVFVLLMKIIPLFVLAILPWFLLVILKAVSINAVTGAVFESIAIPANLHRFFYGFWFLCLWIAAFTTFTRYDLNVWIITNVRIVDIKQWSFFSRQVSSFLLLRVQDVTTDVSGMVATLVGFGSLDVETAGNSEKFSMDGIANPAQVRDIIMSQIAELHASDSPGSGL